MAAPAPQLPPRFPCWCRAVYSWGGETKRDLGFVEGDLIECLNAGDGRWWTGRLWRDRRMVGQFPSNFVEVLGEDFVPVSGSASPSPMMNPKPSPKKQKTVYRKPFQAHKEAMAPSAELSRTATTATSAIPQAPPRKATVPKAAKPLALSGALVTQQSPRSRPASRSGAPSNAGPPSRAASPRPPTRGICTPSPVVPQHRNSVSQPGSREVSPLHLPAREESPPPPPPPPHRVPLTRRSSRSSRSPAPYQMNERYVSLARTPSPAPPPDAHGHTPSPLRDAMEDVISSLEDMGLPVGTPSPSPSPMFNNPWSSDIHESLSDRRPSHNTGRPLTSLGFDGGREQTREGPPHRNSAYTVDNLMDGPPQLNNYVQRMESRLRQLQEQNRRPSADTQVTEEDDDMPPPLPQKNVPYRSRTNSIPVPFVQGTRDRFGYDPRESVLNRTITTKSNATTSSSGVQSTTTIGTASTGRTSQSIMSGPSAGGFSATSAASFARRGTADLAAGVRPGSAMETFRSRGFSDLTKASRPETPLSGVSYHSSHNTSRQGASSAVPWSSAGHASLEESPSIFGGLATPKTKKHGFFKKILESAKTGAASARSSIAVGHSGSPYSPGKLRALGAVSPLPSARTKRESAQEAVPADSSPIDWVQVRRDVNRATSPSRNERVERAERCQMMDHPVVYAVEELRETAEGDESIDGLPISEPTNFNSANLALVDKSSRFINSLPPLTNPASLAQGYVCRPYKSDVQRLRAVFTWVSEKIAWDDPVEGTDVDLKRVLQMKRGSPQEVACLVQEMCAAVGLHAETIHGFLKTPGEPAELDGLSRPNHWWNAVLVDGEWRMMDCSLASPTHPRRSQFVTASTSHAETWYFLARPLEICYTHVPLYPEEQHICPPISPVVLLALPTVCPPYFKNTLDFPDYDTSLVRIENLEVLQIRVLVPADVECAAEVEVPAFARDADGDFFESGDIVRKRALVQPDWAGGQKRFTIKAVLPGDEGQGVLKVYAGKKGLMHSSRDIPHPLALALPIIHTGENPYYDFVLRHPTPHAQRHDLYIMQPQCGRLAINNTFVFAVRQHPSSPSMAPSTRGSESSVSGRISPAIFSRPSSALSMVSSSAGGSNVSTVSNEFSASTSAISSTRSGSGREKPAKLAIQSPSGKILRLTRKADHMISTSTDADSTSEATGEGSVWETVIKIGERGIWRGLVLADRVARWCVFCEWECF